MTDTPPARDPVRIALRAMPMILFLSVCVLVVRYSVESTISADAYFHLRFGHEFLTDWSLRHPGSVTSLATREWLPTQWSAQMAMAALESRFGLVGMAWYTGAQILVLVGTLYLTARRHTSGLAAALITFFAVVASQQALSGRPQVLSYVFVAVFTAAWLESVRDGRPRWWLVPLVWVWATVHGMWPLGIVIGLAAATGILLDRVHPLRARLRLFLVPALGAVAAALTPVGPALYGAVLTVGARAAYFSEWGAPNFTGRMALLPAVMLALTLTLRLRRGGTPWSDVILLAVAGGFVLYSIRTLPVAVAMMTPLLATALAPYTGQPPISRRELLGVFGGVLGSMALLALVVPRPPEPGVAQEDWADEALDALPAGTVLLNNQLWGGYLMWRHPQLDLVTHGYGDTFTDAELDRNLDIETLQPGWEQLLQDTGARVALLGPDSALAYALETGQGWTVVRESDDMVLLEAPDDSAG